MPAFLNRLPILVARSSELEFAINPLFLWFVVIGGFLLLIAGLRFANAREEARLIRSIQLSGIDDMSGIDFERYLQRLLEARGYVVQCTPASNDFGVDLVASSNRQRIAIQVKRSRNRISRRAVSDAVAAKTHYGCNSAMVITNNYFTRGAAILAQSTDCSLVDRSALAEWIKEFQEPGRRQYKPIAFDDSTVK
jgi:restriction system protein